MKEVKVGEGFTITGLAALAADLPDDRWYELRIRLRKTETGAEVLADPDITPLTPQPS